MKKANNAFIARATLRTGALILALISSACGRAFELPALDETGDETAEVIEVTPAQPNNPAERAVDAQAGKSIRLLLNQAMTLRYEKNSILEFKVELPAGSQIDIPENYEVLHLDYRKSDGAIERSSTGFIKPVTIVSVPEAARPSFPQSKIDQLNKTSGGLYVFASIVSDIVGVTGSFPAIKGAAAGAEFLKHYDEKGKPKFNYTSGLVKRFGSRVDKGVSADSLSSAEKTKWTKIYTELKRAGDRTVETPKAIIMIDKSTALKKSEAFEKDGTISPNGAWTIAVQGTAVRHGFANVPCAEFMSEMIREAYQRAGYRLTDDFNKTKGNYLSYADGTAAVVNLSAALNKAGWIPWDASKYRPMTGAIVMHTTGNSPGHTYMAAGHDGRLIVDNGAPQGRDLRKTKAKTIDIMFRSGVFFLPPGVNPAKW